MTHFCSDAHMQNQCGIVAEKQEDGDTTDVYKVALETRITSLSRTIISRIRE